MQVLSEDNQHVYTQLVKLADGDDKLMLDILVRPLPERPAALGSAATRRGFFTGFYFPQTVTRESVPLSQLAGIVAIAFFLHAASFGITNGLCSSSKYVSCIAIDHLMPILKADSRTASDAVRSHLEGNS